MAQTGYTPILIYSSSTASNVPLAANLTNSTGGSELAINITDGKLFYKDNTGTVQVIASKASTTNVSSITFGSTGLTPSTATTGAVTVAGTLATTNGGTGLTSFTSGGAVYATSTSALTTGTLPISAGGTNSTATPTAGGVGYGTGTAHAYTSAGTSGQALISAGAGAPSFGTLGVAGGGTGLTTYTTNGLVYASGSTTLTQTPAPTISNTYLYWTGTAFAWGSVATSTTITATSSNATYYLNFQSATSGTTTTDYVNANITVNPSLGTLSAPQVAASNGIVVNNRTIAVSYSIPSGYSAMSAGPITVNSGAVVTVPSGSKWVVL